MGFAYVVGQVSVKDAEKWAEYQQRVPETFGPWGCEPVLRGKQIAALSGSCPHPAVVVLRFPGPEALKGWFESPAYQALIPLRDAAADVARPDRGEVGGLTEPTTRAMRHCRWRPFRPCC